MKGAQPSSMGVVGPGIRPTSQPNANRQAPASCLRTAKKFVVSTMWEIFDTDELEHVGAIKKTR